MRRIVLQLADDTTDERCGDCYYKTAPGYCDVYGSLAADDVDDMRHKQCRSAELRPETVMEIRGALREVTASRMTYEGEERTVQTLADFERLFGGGE